jgi:hypothetical protein
MPAIPNAAERRAVGATLFSMDAAPKAQLMGYVVKLGTRSCAGSWIERRWEPPLDTGSRLPSAPKHAQSKAGTFDARPWASTRVLDVRVHGSFSSRCPARPAVIGRPER